jgi:hypothetical protein
MIARTRSRVAVAAAAALLAALVVAPAAAHNLSVAHLDIAAPAADGTRRVELDLSLRDLALTLPLDANHDEALRWGELLAARPAIEAMVAAGLRLSDKAGACTLTPTALATRRYDDGAYATLVLQARCRANAGMRVDYDLLFETDPQHRALVTVHGRDAGVSTAIARADAHALAVPDSAGNPFTAFVHEGVGHILSGYDHLAFLLCLLLPAPLVLLARRWQPVEDWRAVAGHTLGLVTAFTVAHSITLSLAALGWVRPSSFWVEASIAASVVLAALNNLWPLVTRRLWMVGFGFGLVHGLGFAGALLEAGLPTKSRLSALLGFNVGVELGQLAIVALVLPLLFATRRWPRYPVLVLRLLSLAVAVLATGWLLQRLRVG